jgi:hypothetical protein
MAETRPYEIQGAGGRRYAYKPPEKLAGAVQVLIWIVIACYGARIAATLAVMATHSVEGDLLSVVDGVVTLVWLVALLVCSIVALKWIYRTNANAHSVASGMTSSPPWAVGWFFVPLANLFKPYTAMRETWQVSTRPEAWRSVKVPGLLGWWWGLWIVSSIASNIAGRLDLNALVVVSDVIDVASTLVFLQLVRQLTALQVAMRHGGTFD